MDLLTRSDILHIAGRDNEGVHISLFIPTHRAGAGIEQDRIRWKNLLVEAEEVLRNTGLRSTEAAQLLAAAWEIHDDGLLWQGMSDGLAYFAAPAWRQYLRVPVNLPDLGIVGNRFVVGPLLPILATDARFLLLVVSQKRVRLLEGNKYRLDEVALRDVPTSLRDVIAPPDRRSDAMARRTTGRGTVGTPGAVFYGYGAADKDFRKTEIEQFLHEVDAGLHEYLRDEQIPMVLAGAEPVVPIFRAVSSYPHVVDQALLGNFDDQPITTLHEQVWPIVDDVLHQAVSRAVARFRELHGTGRALSDPEEIEAAATAGRIDTLIFSQDPACWQRGHDPGRVVRLGTGAANSHCERLDRSAVESLRHGGQILAVGAAEMPGDGDVAAILRY